MAAPSFRGRWPSKMGTRVCVCAHTASWRGGPSLSGARGSDGVSVGAGCWLGQRGRPLHSMEEGGNVLSPVAGHLKGHGLLAPRAFLPVQPRPVEQGVRGHTRPSLDSLSRFKWMMTTSCTFEYLKASHMRTSPWPWPATRPTKADTTS